MQVFGDSGFKTVKATIVDLPFERHLCPQPLAMTTSESQFYDGAVVSQGIKLFASTSRMLHVTVWQVMAAPVALIQGASRGLGLEFCRHILRHKNPAAVVAACRSPDGAAELRRVAEQHPGRVTVLRLDVDREDEVRSAAARVRETFGRLDLLVNSSAMLHPSGKGETSLRDVSAQVKRTRGQGYGRHGGACSPLLSSLDSLSI